MCVQFLMKSTYKNTSDLWTAGSYINCIQLWKWYNAFSYFVSMLWYSSNWNPMTFWPQSGVHIEDNDYITRQDSLNVQGKTCIGVKASDLISVPLWLARVVRPSHSEIFILIYTLYYYYSHFNHHSKECSNSKPSYTLYRHWSFILERHWSYHNVFIVHYNFSIVS